ncbi:MAG: indolepyruvate oxidoreductase subunit beta [Deltaproteobacteria bacterium]
MKKDKTTNILFCGTGGQGVLSAAEICGWAAVNAGYHVKKSEVHGMAQRGGSVESHLRFGSEVHSPLIPAGRVDFLVAFHKDEEARLRHLLSPDGVDLVDSLDAARKAVPDRRFVNIYLLGVLSRSLPFDEASWTQAIGHVLANKRTQENLEIFFKGRGEK